MKRFRGIIIFSLYTGAVFFVSTLLVILFYRLFPEKNFLIFVIAPLFGILFGVLCYLPFKSLSEKE